MLEDHTERFAGQVGVNFALALHSLEARRGAEQLEHFVAGQIGVLDQAAAAQARADGEGVELLRRSAPERGCLQVLRRSTIWRFACARNRSAAAGSCDSCND